MRLLDVGCGTGTLLALAGRQCPGVEGVGIDLSARMLGIAREKLPARIDLVQADAAKIPFPPDAFDVVVSASAFHYWPEPQRVLGEIKRVLRPGGKLVVTDWCDDYLACKLCDWWLRRFDRAHVRTYGTRQCEIMLATAGFSVTGIERYKVSWLWGLMTAVARRAR